MPTRFADTTALFEYHAGTGKTRTEARTILSPRDEVVTSEAVVREWKRIVFQTVRDFIEAAEKEPDLSAALARLSWGFGRVQSQRLRAASLIASGSNALDTTHIKIRGNQLLRGDAERRLTRTVSNVRTPSECGLAGERPSPSSDGRWELKLRCRRREGICIHEDRLANDLERWSAGAAALGDSDDRSMRNMGGVASDMAEQPAVRTGKNCYERTGDIAIALDCERDEMLVTTDASFDVLKEAMGFEVHRISGP